MIVCILGLLILGLDYSTTSSESSEESIKYKDIVRQQLLDKGVSVSGSGSSESGSESEMDYEDLPAAKKEDLALKAFREKAFGSEESESESDDFLVKRKKVEVDKGENIKKFVSEQDDVVKNYWMNTDDKDENEKFLIKYVYCLIVYCSYFLNKKWDEDEDDYEVPTYDELMEVEDLIQLKKAENFERQYNFRHEEPYKFKYILILVVVLNLQLIREPNISQLE